MEDEPSHLTQYPDPFRYPSTYGNFWSHLLTENIISLAELRMQSLSWEIRCEKGWQDKIKNRELMKQWRKEVESRQEQLRIEEKISDNMINYVFTELEAHARVTDPETETQYACNDATFCSYNLISESLNCELLEGVVILEDVPEDRKDWRPESRQQVLDLVHPFMYCLVYHQTLVRSDNTGLYEPAVPPSQGGTPALPTGPQFHWALVSDQSAWIPSDFFVSETGEVHLMSPYINNLPTTNKAIYSAIPKILERFVPMFERVLGAVDQSPYIRGRYAVGLRRIFLDGQGYVPCVWEDEMPELPDDDSYGGYGGYYNWCREQPLRLPESPDVYEGSLEDNFCIADLKGRTLQVIVELSNIYLTPQNSVYPAGTWHFEGMLNERIVATGVYFYDSENVTDSRLEFRTTVRHPEAHLFFDDFCMAALFGFESGDSQIQERGSIMTVPGLALAFPNAYHHRYSPFSLVDDTKPGHRKMLKLSLVDPNTRIPSASDIRPQQEDWILGFLRDVSEEGIGGTRLGLLPVELREMIMEELKPGLVSREEAVSVWEMCLEGRNEIEIAYMDEAVNGTVS